MQKTSHDQQIAVIIVAAGRGTRAHGDSDAPQPQPKQYRLMPDGQTVLRHSLQKFCYHPDVDKVLSVIHPDDTALYEQTAQGLPNLLPPVMGGTTRQDSVFAGLTALATQNCDYVLVHDGARPFVDAALISRVIQGLETHACVIPALEVTDTLKQIHQTSENGYQVSTPDRAQFRHAQTPQGFRFQDIYEAHQNTDKNQSLATDDAALMAADTIGFVEGSPENIKLTRAEDFTALMANQNLETRTASGYDVHAFHDTPAPQGAQFIKLGGVTIEHTHQLIGHSDADVALHALTDALLGTLALGDIGDHFPPSDMAHKNRDSADFLRHAVDLLTRHQAKIVHLDLTIICEAPKIKPHRETMRQQIADICGISRSRVSVKATTTEKLGFTGREEGIAAQAMASIQCPAHEHGQPE